MPRSGRQPPPDNYDCPYRDCCPHLEGLPTAFAFGEYQRSYEEQMEHWKVRDELNELLEKMRRRTQELEAENAQLKARLSYWMT